jgi:hypothetical protein
MPKFGADPTGAVKSSFGYSAIDISTLKDSEYTLVGIVADRSGSVASFAREEEKALKEIVAACHRSPRADLLMLRYTTFDDRIGEVHGFKLLQDCNGGDYDNTLSPGGMTALYDASINGVDAIARFGRDLVAKDYTANGILFVITDGDNNSGMNMNPAAVKQAVQQALQTECLESLVTILIGVNVQDPSMSTYLSNFAQVAGFTQYVEIAKADEKTLAKLAAFVSKSISSQSQALGTGGPSQALTF